MPHPFLPSQPQETPWPSEDWPRGAPADDVDRTRLDSAAEQLFDDAGRAAHGRTLAFLAIHRGWLVAERYATGKGPGDPFRSWSMAKGVVHALAGILVGEGKLDLHAPAPVRAWSHSDDPRRGITLEHLLRMVDGLDFVEFDEASGRCDVIDMLEGAGARDTAAYAESRPALHAPGHHWSYSSAASILLCAILGRTVGGGREEMASFMRRRLFDPIGMVSAAPRFDPAGTFLGSSYCFATARDFARLGYLYLRDGVWDGSRVLPAGWVDHARTVTEASDGAYGAHWWLATDGTGAFSANGFQGQYVVVVPGRDVVVVRLGSSTPAQRVNVVHRIADAVGSFPAVGSEAHV